MWKGSIDVFIKEMEKVQKRVTVTQSEIGWIVLILAWEEGKREY